MGSHCVRSIVLYTAGTGVLSNVSTAHVSLFKKKYGKSDLWQSTVPSVPRSCFLSWTAKSSHHPMAALTPKERLCQEETLTSRIYHQEYKREVMQLRRTRQKTIFPCVGGKFARCPPPPPKEAGLKRRVPTWGPAEMTRHRSRDDTPPVTWLRERGGG